MMEDCCGGSKSYQKPSYLEIEHIRARDKAIYQFTVKRKMGGDEFSETYKQQLIDFIEESFNQYKAHNESKNIFKAAQTPSVFFFIALIAYMVSGIFAIFGMETFANLFSFCMAGCIIALVVWSYVR